MKKIRLWQQGLLHGLILWAAFNLNSVISYWYKVQRSGFYIFNSDKSPVTIWQSFTDLNYYQKIWINCLVIGYFAELSYHFVFQRKPLYPYLFSTLFRSATLVLLGNWWSMYKHETDHTFVFTVPFLVLSGYTVLYSVVRDYFRKQQEEKARKIQQKDSEINALRAQVNPHFFFNTLNTIYGTALQENADRTARCVEQLSHIMRYITETGRDLTPLSEEVSFIENYFHLQKLRIPDRDNIRVKTSISMDNPSLKIAPLLLLPFIENAFKYGISTEHPCEIKIQMDVKDKVLHFQAKNSCFKNQPDGLGTGIENVRQRLGLIYPGRHRLSYGPDGPYFKVSLTLHLD